MRKAVSGFEDVFFVCAAIAGLLAAAGALLLQPRFHFHNERVQYGVEHLPAALLGVFLFTALVGVTRRLYVGADGVEGWPVGAYLGVLVAVFCMCWLPTLLAGGFVEDDWMLLAAASVRKIIYLHPAYSWFALDSVDGNFRPLGTVLYFGYMWKLFGQTAFAFLLGGFLINLLGSLVAFFIVREMGYSKVAGAAAALLYITRGMIYTIVTWAAALGDGIVILLCGLMALAILKANKLRGPGVWAWHGVAWGCFCLATLAKQSAFAAPLIVALLLFFRPGVRTGLPSLRRRVMTAAIGLGVYGATAAVPFYHAKALSQAQTPYPISFSFTTVLNAFSYVTWYVSTLDFPPQFGSLNLLSRFVGMALLAGLIVLLRRVPRLLGERPRDVVFALLATVASISLFIVLSTRTAAYYGSMAAFWFSIALGIVLTRYGAPPDNMPALENLPARLCCFAFCVLVALGFADIRIKQTALVPAGGYTWGTFGMDREHSQYGRLRDALRNAPQTEVLVLDDFLGYPSYYTSMALLIDPDLRSILVYDSSRQTYLANDLHGSRPKDELGALRDTQAYNWTVPMGDTEAAAILGRGHVLRLEFRGGNIGLEDSTKALDR